MAMEQFTKSIDRFLKDGVAEWNGCILTRSLNKIGKGSLPQESVKNVEKFLQKLLNQENTAIKTYVGKKVYTKTASLSGTPVNGSMPLFTHGCPLELEDLGDMSISETGIHDSAIIEQPYLVPENLAQEIMSHICCYFTVESQKDDKEESIKNLFPMLIFCKWRGSLPNPSGVIFINSMAQSDGKILGLIEKRLSLRGPHPSTIWCEDTTGKAVSSQSPKHFEFHTKCINNLVKHHLSGGRPNSRPISSIQCFAEYDLFDSNKQFSDTPDEDVSLMNVTVSIKCDKVQKILHINKPTISDVKIHVSPVPGDMRSSGFTLFKAIQILEGLFCAFDDAGEVRWTSIDDLPSKDGSDPKPPLTITEQIHKVIASYNNEWMMWQNEREQSTKDDKGKDKSERDEQTVDSNKVLLLRKELDFTEQIWEILQYVGGCQELIESFQIILKEITECRGTQFWLQRNNNTTIAKLIKESYTGKISTQIVLNGPNCIMLLIELGLDKLCRDYQNFFIASRFSSARRLEAYLDSDTMTELNDTMVQKLQQRFTKMKKLHHITELIVQCKLFLNLSYEVIFNVAKTALQDYVDEELDFKKTFSFSINYGAIESLVKDKLPTMWKLIICSKENNLEKMSSHCWSLEYLLKGIVGENFMDHDSEDTEYRNLPINSTSTEANGGAMEYHIATMTTTNYIF